MSVMVIVYLITSIFYICIGASSLMYDTRNRINRIFFLLCLDLSLWSMMLMLMNTTSDPVTATFFRRKAVIFWSLVYCMLLHFLLALVRKDDFLNKTWFLVLFYLPAMISIYLYYYYIPSSPENIVRNSWGWAYLNKLGDDPLWNFYLVVYYSTYALACVILVLIWGKQSNLKREKKQAKIIAGSIVAVLILGSMTDIILPILEMPKAPALTVCFIVIPVSGVWYSIRRFRLMNLSPQNVVGDVYKTMKEGLIITDREHRIRDINVGASMMLGFSREELEGKSINCVMMNYSCEETVLPDKSEMVLRRKDNGQMEVLFSSSTLLDEWKEPYGTVYLFQDLTEIKKIQKELQISHNELEQKVQERTRELNMINEELKKEIQTRINMENEIRKLAYYDHLTGLSNKKRFIDYVNDIIQTNSGQTCSLSVLYLDLDSFKMINDTMGHVKGDELLKKVSERLISTVRINDAIARVGGDEFIVLVNSGNEKVVSTIASRLNEAFRKKFVLDGNEVYVTVSIGVAVYPADGEDAETLIKNADIAMNKAKEKGKNKYELCNSSMKADIQETMKLTNDLYKAVDRKEFELHYQPQVDVNTGGIVGFEALIRWKHPELGIVSPGRFIPIAEKTGLILQIGEWVMQTACRQMKQWHDQGLIRVPVAVNLSVRQFMDYDLVGLVTRVLLETGLEPRYLELEITESILMEDTKSICETLKHLNKMGIRVSIDDFGMKYSSLNYLKQIPFHRLKIDMSFVQGISVNPKDEIIIDGIITLARNLGIDVLAEGVETCDQLEFLKKSKCFCIQGYYLYRPMMAEKVPEILPK